MPENIPQVTDETPIADLLSDEDKKKLTRVSLQLLTMRDLDSIHAAFKNIDDPDPAAGTACCCCCCARIEA